MNIRERVRGARRRVGEVSLSWARWTADGGSGVEPGSVLFARFFAGGGPFYFRSGQVRATQSGA
jgi:hypothetical protein